MSTSEASRRIPRPSHNFVPEYQQSGIPHVETRTLVHRENAGEAGIIANIDDYKFTFDYVTRWVEIHNHGADNQAGDVRLYFNETAAKTALSGAEDSHYYIVSGQSRTNRSETKCKVLWLIPNKAAGADFEVSVVAGLTSVDSKDFPEQKYENGFLGIQNNPNP